ncbi:MAG: hypothetical protein F4Z31_04940 [Gemmatimonadetes bacterium]|nr:hypothetical protein [Gemmatimonadota bacterium]MYE93538.1 hypothetical protein [Gemmatimonadota bacterium]MYJ12219.1 hypothetical protein [Gemmatimonadota bacterium]
MSARRRPNRFVHRQATSMVLFLMWASASSRTSPGESERPSAQSCGLERNACGTAPIPSSRPSFEIGASAFALSVHVEFGVRTVTMSFA